MALGKSYAAALASVSNAAGGTTNSSAITLGYGTSIIGKVTNGATGPTVGCDVVPQVSNDASTWFEVPGQRATCPTANSATTLLLFTFGIGLVGDWTYGRLQFTGNTGQAVTVQADESTTTGV